MLRVSFGSRSEYGYYCFRHAIDHIDEDIVVEIYDDSQEEDRSFCADCETELIRARNKADDEFMRELNESSSSSNTH